MESAMTENRKESWLELCALASVEQDPEKLLVLVAEIEHLLAADDPPEKPARSTTLWPAAARAISPWG